MSKKRMLALVLAAVLSLSSATVALADGESTAPVTETTTSTDETGGKQPGDEGNDLTETEETETGEQAPDGETPETPAETTVPKTEVPAATNAVTLDGTAELAALAEDNVLMQAEITNKQLTLDNSYDGKTVVLGENIIADIVVNADVTVIIDLAGKTLTNSSDHTITNRGNLTIMDTVGSGVVDNVTHAKSAIHNAASGTVVLNGGSYTRSAETGQNAEVSGKNSFYNIQNYGDMTINEGVTVKQNGAYSSLIENGYYDGTQKDEGSPAPTMVINGGTFSGGLNTIKNDDWGVLQINGGSFENIAQSAVLNWNEATISGGYFETEAGATSSVILNGSTGTSDHPGMDQGKLEIKGGEFKPGNEKPVIAQMGGSDNNESATVTGGVFHSSVADTKYGKVETEDVIQVKVENNGAVTYRFGANARNFEATAGDIVTVTDNPKNEEIVLTGGETVTVKNATDTPIKVNGTTVSANNATGVEIEADGEVKEPAERNRNDDGDYFGNETWDEVKDQIAEAEEGDTIKVSATGLPYFPSSVARALKGLDITLEVRKNGVTYEVNGLEIGDIDKIWYEFDELEAELLTADADSEAPAAEDEDKANPDTGR